MVALRPHLLAGPVQAGELTQSLGISRPTLLDAYRREQATVLRYGRGRNTWYAARERFPQLGTDHFPVFRVNESGVIVEAGELVTLAGNHSIWLPDMEVVFGLPTEMQDVAPKGFLGRTFARNNLELDLPDDVNRWSDNHVLIAISRRGEDLPGNLVIGGESFDRYQQLDYPVHTIDDLEELAKRALAGEQIGSSAGGEQPKYSVLIEGKHRIVKFALGITDNARRWKDLLALEHLALTVLAEAGLQSSRAELIDQGEMRCLMVDRFDRIGIKGRRAVLTLAGASGQVNGSWTDAAQELAQEGQINAADLTTIALLDAFGAQIANTDRHLYNVAFFRDGANLKLAPAFDQLPMAYAPPASGHLRTEAVAPALPRANTLGVWAEATAIARDFWQRASDIELGESMREIVNVHRERLV